MGLKGRGDDPKVAEVIRGLEDPIRTSPVILGGEANTPRQASEMIEKGYRALVVGFDWSLLQQGIEQATQGIR